MKVLVTGNKGYIGSVLCEKLIAQGFTVIGLDTDFYRGCNFLDLGYTVKQISKDIRDVAEADLTGINTVIHLAALSNDPMGALNPQLTSEINYSASLRLAMLAKKSGVKRFIFSSSCSVYGVAGDEMIDETGCLRPETEYARSKVESELAIGKLADKSFSPVFLRNATVYGISPMLRVDLVVNNLAGWAFTTGKIKVMSDGSPWRPLIHIQDICKAFIAVLKAPQEIIHNQVFNVGNNNQNYRVRDIVSAVKKEMPGCEIEFTGEHGHDTRTYRVNFNKITNLLGDYFKPQWDIEKGIKEIITFYKKNCFTLEDFTGDKFIRLRRIKKLISDGRVDANLFWKEKNHD